MLQLPLQLARASTFSNEDALTLVTHSVWNGDYPPHSHDFIEVVIVVDGEGIHSSMNGDMSIGRGNVIVIRPGVWHAYSGCHQMDYYNCCFDMRMLYHELAWIREDRLLNYLLWSGPLSAGRRGIFDTTISDASISGCTAHLDALHALEQERLPDLKSDVIGYLLLFLGTLARTIVQKPMSREVISYPHHAVLKSTQLLENNLPDTWTLSRLAQEVHLHPAYLVRIFTANTGLSPMAYLAQLRAERAAALLLNTDASIAQIGSEVGWNDASYFARRFRAYFGMSAGEYRRKFGRKD